MFVSIKILNDTQYANPSQVLILKTNWLSCNIVIRKLNQPDLSTKKLTIIIPGMIDSFACVTFGLLCE